MLERHFGMPAVGHLYKGTVRLWIWNSYQPCLCYDPWIVVILSETDSSHNQLEWSHVPDSRTAEYSWSLSLLTCLTYYTPVSLPLRSLSTNQGRLDWLLQVAILRVSFLLPNTCNNCNIIFKFFFNVCLFCHLMRVWWIAVHLVNLRYSRCSMIIFSIN